MKKLNFSNAPNAEQHKQMHRFIRITIASIISLCSILAWTHIKLYQDSQAKKELLDQLAPITDGLHKCLEQKRITKEELKREKKTLFKSKRIAQRPKNPAPILLAIQQALPAGSRLEKIEIKKKRLNLSIAALDTQSVMQFFQYAQTCQQIEQLEIISLKPQPNGIIIATLKGRLAWH